MSWVSAAQAVWGAGDDGGVADVVIAKLRNRDLTDPASRELRTIRQTMTHPLVEVHKNRQADDEGDQDRCAVHCWDNRSVSSVSGSAARAGSNIRSRPVRGEILSTNIPLQGSQLPLRPQ